MGGNRYRCRKTRQQILCDDKPDSDILFKIKKYLRKEHHIPFNRIKIGYAIRITRGRCVILGRLTRAKIAGIRGLVRTPDIIVTDGNGKPWFIIEQDGRIHDSGRQMRKDETRGKHYRYGGIPCIVLNTKKIRTKKKKPGIYLDEMMHKMGITK